jgi:hypothetical protein
MYSCGFIASILFKRGRKHDFFPNKPSAGANGYTKLSAGNTVAFSDVIPKEISINGMSLNKNDKELGSVED